MRERGRTDRCVMAVRDRTVGGGGGELYDRQAVQCVCCTVQCHDPNNRTFPFKGSEHGTLDTRGHVPASYMQFLFTVAYLLIIL
jgi:hypothetical protein